MSWKQYTEADLFEYQNENSLLHMYMVHCALEFN